MPERLSRKELLKLAAISIVIDLFTTLVEIPFLPEFFISLPLKEFLEQIISTLIARSALQLSFTDRMIGLIPIPGVTAVTVRVVRELLKQKK